MKPSSPAGSPPDPLYKRRKRKGGPDTAYVWFQDPDSGQMKSKSLPGSFNSDRSVAAFHRFCEDWLNRNQSTRLVECSQSKLGVSLTQLHGEYVLAMRKRYRHSDGSQTGHAAFLRLAVDRVVEHYPNLPAKQFTRDHLLALRKTWEDQSRQYRQEREKIEREMRSEGLDPKTTPLSRKPSVRSMSIGHINKMIQQITHMIAWGTKQSPRLVPLEVLADIQAIEKLSPRDAQEHDLHTSRGEKQPVPRKHVEKTLEALSHTPPVQAIVRFSLLTGCRISEACRLKLIDIDRTDGHDGCWAYRPEIHKSEFRGRERVIFLGPQAQQLIRDWERRVPRPSKHQPLWSPQTIRRSRAKKEQYDLHAVRTAVQRAAKRAGVPTWTPGQLRHTRLTEIRKKFGVDVAEAVAGHCDPGVIARYTRLTHAEHAAQAMARVG